MIDVIDLLQAAEDDDDNNIVYSPYPSHPYILLLYPYLLFSPSHTPPISLCCYDCRKDSRWVSNVYYSAWIDYTWTMTKRSSSLWPDSYDVIVTSSFYI